jgi:hypothetical protein
MKTNALTAQNCSLFEIDGELEAAFDQMQEEREITGNISDESRELLPTVVRIGVGIAVRLFCFRRSLSEGCVGPARKNHSIQFTIVTRKADGTIRRKLPEVAYSQREA